MSVDDRRNRRAYRDSVGLDSVLRSSRELQRSRMKPEFAVRLNLSSRTAIAILVAVWTLGGSVCQAQNQRLDQQGFDAQAPIGQANSRIEIGPTERSQPGLGLPSEDVLEIGEPAQAASETIQLLPPQASDSNKSNGRSPLGGKPPWVTTFGSLGVVLAAFFVLAWFIKRTRPKGHNALPFEAVELLGRSALDGKQHLQVVRFGNKLLLIAVSPNASQTLCELSDTDEINHVIELCQRSQPGSVTDSFRQVFQQMGREKTKGGFLGETEAEEQPQAQPRQRTRSRALFEA